MGRCHGNGPIPLRMGHVDLPRHRQPGALAGSPAFPMTTANVIATDFQTAPKPGWTHEGSGVYSRPDRPGFYERPTILGKRSWRKLASRTLRLAKLEAGKNRSTQQEARAGLVKDPYLPREEWTVGQVLDFYIAAGAPMRSERPRTGLALSEETRRAALLKEFIKGRDWNKVNVEDWRKYATWRKKRTNQARGSGLRAIDLERHTLRSAYRWAKRNPSTTAVMFNPVDDDWPVFSRPDTVEHCRDYQPRDADHLHALARELFGFYRSESLGWQLLFAAFTGRRTNELLKLRLDAAPRGPGYVEGLDTDSPTLWTYQSKTHKGTFPYVDIGPEFRACIEAHRAWHRSRWPAGSGKAVPPWYFPGLNPAQPVETTSLAHALLRITKTADRQVTPHGLRSYFANLLRSQGMPDDQVALRLGQKTRGKLIVEVYGEILPGKLTWIPATSEPAWTVFQ